MPDSEPSREESQAQLGRVAVLISHDLVIESRLNNRARILSSCPIDIIGAFTSFRRLIAPRV